MSSSNQYLLNRLPLGIVVLDTDDRVVSYSGEVAKIFGSTNMERAIGKTIQAIHPEHSRSKIEWLIAQARDDHSSEYASMLISVPDTILQLRMVRLSSGDGDAGFCLILYDITDLTSSPVDSESSRRSLVKIPISTHGRIALVGMDQVTLLRANGHYTDVCVDGNHHLCGIPLSELEARLDPNEYVRVHRSFIINMARAESIDRDHGQYFITMSGSCTHAIPVSRGHVARLKELLGV